jgi:DNA polymerase III delta subunit
LRGARPPIFFKLQDSFRRQLTRWAEPQLRRQLDALVAVEAQIKSTGMPDQTLCRAALFAMAAAVRAQPGRSSVNRRSS